jgi:hypothetical protein
VTDFDSRSVLVIEGLADALGVDDEDGVLDADPFVLV